LADPIWWSSSQACYTDQKLKWWGRCRYLRSKAENGWHRGLYRLSRDFFKYTRGPKNERFRLYL